MKYTTHLLLADDKTILTEKYFYLRLFLENVTAIQFSPQPCLFKKMYVISYNNIKHLSDINFTKIKSNNILNELWYV